MFKNIYKKLHLPSWLLGLLVLVFVLRIPSFFEPYSYGDEMIYLALGEGIRQGVPLYSGIHDNKPPLLYIFAALTGSLFWFKVLLAGWHLVTVVIFWKLSGVFFEKSEKARMIATGIFSVFTTIPLLEGNIINSELFMIGPIMLGFLILLTKRLHLKNLLLGGSLFALAALFKMPAIFDFPVIFVYWLFTEKELNTKRFVTLFRKSWPLVLGFAIPILLTFVWFYFSNSLREYIVAAFLQNVGYLSTFRPGDVQKPFLVKNGPLLLRAIIVIIAMAVLYIKRKKLSREFMFATIWLFFTLFAVSLSERPYPHYLIQSVAPISLLFTMLIVKQTMEQVYAIIPLVFAFLVPVYFKFWYYPTTPYYTKFVNLVTGNTTREEYLASYGDHVPRNYKVAEFVASSTYPYEKIFVWGDGAPIYALSRRVPTGKYVADYHIKDFSNHEEVISTLAKDAPSIIVLQPGTETFPKLEYFVMKNYGLTETIDGAQIWKLLNPKVRSLFYY